MIKKYKSKIGLGLVLFLVIILGGTSLLMLFFGAWPGLVIILLVSGFILYLFRSTYYQIIGNDLIVKSGFLVSLTIPIEQIHKISETNNPLSSPATSLDRIAIYYNVKDQVMISPADKEQLINHLTGINSKIEVIRGK